MKQPKISVIVPIYNVKKYLQQCLDSIVGQTLKDLEIILINDGSKDNSLQIVREYEKRDGRIVVIDKSNEGYGKTMNRGLDIATGKYIGIVESDDWIEPDMYETLYALAMEHEVDVVKCRYICFDDVKQKAYDVSYLPDVNTIIDPRKDTRIFYIGASIWSAIYRADFLRDNDIRFLESPGASYQDTAFNFKVWASVKCAYLSERPLLHYRTGHCTQSSKSKDKVFCVCDEFAEIERWMNKNHPDWFSAFEKVYNRAKYGSYIWNWRRLNAENRAVFLKQYAKEFKDVVKRKTIDFSYMSKRDKARFNVFVNPTLWNKIKYFWVRRIERVFFVDCVNIHYVTYFLFAFIPIWRRKTKTEEIRLPM